MLQTLDKRRSVPAKQLDAPAPDHATQLRMLASAVRVPDHGKRVPFRFVRLEGDARLAFGDAVAGLVQGRDADATDNALDAERGRFAHAPLVIVVVAAQGPDIKIPPSERLLTAGCVCFALLQAAQQAGFGAQWLSGWTAYDRGVQDLLGLAVDEVIAGYIHIGTPRAPSVERERPDPAELLHDWSPASARRAP